MTPSTSVTPGLWDWRVMMPGSPSLLSGHTMAVVFTMVPGSMDSTSLSIPDHGLWCLPSLHENRLRVSYFSQFPTRYRYPGIVTSSVSRDKCDVTWRGSHRSNGNMSPVCQLAHSALLSPIFDRNPPGQAAGCSAVQWVLRLSCEDEGNLSWPRVPMCSPQVPGLCEATTVKQGNCSVSGGHPPNTA